MPMINKLSGARTHPTINKQKPLERRGIPDRSNLRLRWGWHHGEIHHQRGLHLLPRSALQFGSERRELGGAKNLCLRRDDHCGSDGWYPQMGACRPPGKHIDHRQRG